MLDKIVATKREEIRLLPEQSVGLLPQNDRDFLSIFSSFAIVAEMKPKSPSEGHMSTHYVPKNIAVSYEHGGASALSILCDHAYFGGDYHHLTEARGACSLPLLCKEFIIDPKQIYAARLAGASACLLIVRILSDQQLMTLKLCIESLGMVALLEVFNEVEIERALATDPAVIGINNRDLDSLEMDTDLSLQLKEAVPDEVHCMSFSGIKTPEDIQKRHKEGFTGVLVGTALMHSADPARFLAAARL